MLSSHLPAEKELLAHPLRMTSHPERPGCRKLPGPERTPQIEFSHQPRGQSQFACGEGSLARVLDQGEGQLVGGGLACLFCTSERRRAKNVLKLPLG